MKLFQSLFTLFIAFFGVYQASQVMGEDYVLGMWNVEMLSSRKMRGFPERQDNRQFPPRTQQQLERIADYLKDELKVDAIILTEVDDDGGGNAYIPKSAHLDAIKQKLGDQWKYILGRTGSDQRVAFLWNSDRIVYDRAVNLTAPEFEVGDKDENAKDVYDRDPLLVQIRLKKQSANQAEMDLLFVGLHLKSQQHRIHNHMAAAAKLLGDLSSEPVLKSLGLNPDEKEVIIVGDLNDSALKRSGFRYIFDYFDAEDYTHLGPEGRAYPRTRVNGSQIDHVFVSRELIASGAVAEDTFWVHQCDDNNMANDAYREGFSDHFPLTFKVHVE